MSKSGWAVYAGWVDSKEQTAKRRRWRTLPRRAALALLMLMLAAVASSDDLRVTPVERIAGGHIFSIAQWEFENFSDKWVHWLRYMVPLAKPSREERIAILDEYLQTVRAANKEERRIEGASLLRGFQAGGASAKAVPVSDEFLNELLGRERGLRAEAEEAVEAEIAAVFDEIGLGSRFGAVWPPVDIRFGDLPALLVISPRGEINMVGAVFLDPEIEPFERDAIERRVFDEVDYAAYVDDIAGLATFPNMVSDRHTTRTVIRTAAHEWLHSYWFFHPFGRNYFASAEMTTLNETAATLAGNEVGDMAFKRMGGDLSENARRYESEAKANPDFTAFMRETRIETERLLEDGKIEEAEEYMRKRQWDLRLRGYYIRKLNQAYFAFRGRYADSAASVSPVGDQMRELRSYAGDVGEFIRLVSKVSAPAEFEALLAEIRASKAEG